MLSLKNKIIISFFIIAVYSSEAIAGLYGFHNYNPYTKDERILDLKEVPPYIQNYRADMRDNLLMLIRYAKEQNPDFKIIAHEGQNLLTKSLWEYDREGYNRARTNEQALDDSFLFHDNYQDKDPQRYTPEYEYLHSIDAVVINNLYCGKGKERPLAKKYNLSSITIEHCSSQNELDDMEINAMINKKISYGFIDINQAFNNTNGHHLINDSSKNIFQISDAQNVLFLLDEDNYSDKDTYVTELSKTNYDIIIMNPLFQKKERYSAQDIQKLKIKKNGSKRLLIATINVSEANPNDYFWQKDWTLGNPEWLKRKSFYSQDSIITKFWHNDWKKIISNFFKDILNEGFDGIFFTGIENYQYFEQQSPLE